VMHWVKMAGILAPLVIGELGKTLIKSGVHILSVDSSP
jgi:hypothetical protein